MQKIKFLFILLIAIGFSSCLYLNTKAPKERKLRHMVAFRFKPGVTEAQMQKVTEDFHRLKGLVPEIKEFEGGPDYNYQKKTGKFTHCFVVTVDGPEALAAYGVHPDHKAFSKSADPLLAEVVAVDYWTE